MYNFVSKEPTHIFIISAEYITKHFSSVSNFKEKSKENHEVETVVTMFDNMGYGFLLTGNRDSHHLIW